MEALTCRRCFRKRHSEIRLKVWKGNRDQTVEIGDWYTCKTQEKESSRRLSVEKKKIWKAKRKELTKNKCTGKEQTTGPNL